MSSCTFSRLLNVPFGPEINHSVISLRFVIHHCEQMTMCFDIVISGKLYSREGIDQHSNLHQIVLCLDLGGTNAMITDKQEYIASQETTQDTTQDRKRTKTQYPTK